MSLFIGIDSGTQSTKAVVLDLDAGKVVAEARAPHRLIEGLPAGHSEQHPEEWVGALERVMGEVAARIDRARVRGIGVSGQQHGFVPLDTAGEVIRPAKLWNDTSTVHECELLTRELGGGAEVIRVCGLPFLPGYTAPKILWLKRNEPENYKRLRHVLLPHDYLNFHLTGNYAMEPGDASGTALLDVRRRRWSEKAATAIDRNLLEWLPDLHESHEMAGLLKPGLAKKFGFSDEVVVSAGGGDNMMGAIGTGNVSPGIVSASFGTSGTIYAFSRTAVIDPEGEIAAFCSSTGGWLPLACTMNVTMVTEHVRRLFRLDHAGLDAAVREAPLGAGGLTLLPYFTGERTPSVPDGTGVLAGLNTSTFSAPNLARAAMEGVTLGMNYGLRRLRDLGIKPKEIRVTGGGARSSVWRQMMADVFGVPVVGMREEEGAALGSALQAAWCVLRRAEDPRGAIGELVARVVGLEETTRCEPEPADVARYEALQALQDELSRAMRPVFKRQQSVIAKP